MRIGDQIGFVRSFKLPGIKDLRKIVKLFPEHIVLCTSRIVAGPEHAFSVLYQTNECVKRDISLARNRSIDMLMRISCQRQISEAMSISALSKTGELALFGFVPNLTSIDDAERLVCNEIADTKRDDSLLLLTKEKAKYLKQLHKLPDLLSDDQLLVALKEKSVLLVLDR